MEKQRKYRKYEFCFRLLKVLIFSLFLLFQPTFIFSQKLTYNLIKELTVKPVSQNNFSGSECAFELKVPYAKSENVQAQIPELPSGVSFVSLRRSEYSDTETGTKIELWLNFSEAGTYRLRSLRVYINNRLYYIPFDVIHISENPRNILPQLLIIFDDGTEISQSKKNTKDQNHVISTQVGTRRKFTVYLKYAVQMIFFNWSIPKDALFQEIQRFEITKGTLRTSEFSEEKIPVAEFEWEPLNAGEHSLPLVRIVATSYNGIRTELFLPETKIFVTEVEKKVSIKNSTENLFGYAFVQGKSKDNLEVKPQISINECQNIAELRTLERHGIPFGNSYKERKAYEKSLGLEDTAFEPTYFILYIALSLLAFFTIFLVFMIIYKKLIGIITGVISWSFFAIATFVIFIMLSKPYAIFKGGVITPVPENSSGAIASIESGKRVFVEQIAGGWVFVKFGTTGGWISEDNVIFIDR